MSQSMNEPLSSKQAPKADRILRAIDVGEDRQGREDPESVDADKRIRVTTRSGSSFVSVLLRAMSAWPT